MHRFALLFICVALTACGFRPLYEAGGSADAMQQRLASVAVAPVPERLGQILTTQLEDRFLTNGAPEYRLALSLEQSTRGFGVRPDASVAQEELTMVAVMQLYLLGDEQPVIEERVRARTAYDVVLSDFANVQQRDDAARRLVLDIADRVERRLALYFSELG